jgi:hypothetical protein
MNEWYWGFHLLAAFAGFLILPRWDKNFRCNVLSAIVASILWVAIVYGLYMLGGHIAGVSLGSSSVAPKFSFRIFLFISLFITAHPVASVATLLVGNYLLPGFKVARLSSIWLCSVLLTLWVLLASMLANIALWLVLGLGCAGYSLFSRTRRGY